VSPLPYDAGVTCRLLGGENVLSRQISATQGERSSMAAARATPDKMAAKNTKDREIKERISCKMVFRKGVR